MRIDFHFYTIYALARAVGFSPDNAYVIAYASQYTDDEVNENTVLFENGGEFEPVITAHRIFDPLAVSERTCKKVWVPFHFLPGNRGWELNKCSLWLMAILPERLLPNF